jgi:hypothetical protein
MRKCFRPLSAVLSLLLAVCFLMSPASGNAAVSPTLTETDAINLLRTYAIVRGDTSGDLLLNERLTRAQAAALFVRSVGAEDMAQVVADVVPYSDAQGHWAAGEITLATRLNLMKGDGDGTFRPESDITYAEVLTVLLRIVQQEPQGPWDGNTIMMTARQLGFAPEGVTPAAPAIRRAIFRAMAGALSQVPLDSGKTVLQTYVDSIPPQLTLTQSSITTPEAKVTISGTATGASRVTVNGVAASLSGTGQFSYIASVPVGSSQLPVVALDAAGNTASATVTVERRAPVARLEVKGPAAIKVGSGTVLEVHGYDSQGRETDPDGLQFTISGNVATFDLSTKTLRAGTQTGHGVLTLTAGMARAAFAFDVTKPSDRAAQLKIVDINGGHAPIPGKDATVKVQILDSAAKLVTDDYYRSVTLSVDDMGGLSITPHTAQTQGGIATFTINSPVQGVGSLTASSSGLDSDSAAVQVLTAPRVVLVASPTTLKPDGTSTATIRAQLENEIGQTIRNDSASDIEIDLNNSTDEGILSTPSLTIRRGYATSSGTATYQAGIHPTTAVITGTVSGSPRYPVQGLWIPVMGDLQGAKLIISGPTANQAPNGSGATLYVKVVNAQNRIITAGSYAFQLSVTTSNDEALVNGLPEGVDAILSGSSYRPVAASSSDVNYVVGRTYQGTATVQLRYDKSGTVTVRPRAVDGTLEGYHNTAGFGPAASSQGMAVEPFSVTFAGAPSQIQLTADSSLGTDIGGAVVTSARSVTIRARVLDANGAPIPGNRSDVTVTRTNAGTGVTRLSETTGTSLRKTAVDGEVEFTVQATSVAGFDVYTATSGSLHPASITVSVRKTEPDSPIIATARGVRNGSTPADGYVAPDDDYMDILLEPQAPPNGGEPTNWATAKVYRKGESAPFFTGAAVDLNSAAPVVRVPKSKLTRFGSYCYQVSLSNVAGETDRSIETPACVALNATYNANYRLLSAQYDAASGTLALATSGLAANGVVKPEYMSIVKADDELSLASPEVSVASVSSASVVLQLGPLAGLVTPARFNGMVTIQALDGWYTSQDGAQIARAIGDKTVKPMGFITSATLNLGASRLYINGIGLKQGTLSLGLVSFGDSTDSVPLRPGTTAAFDRISTYTDTQLVVSLSPETLSAFRALDGPALSISAEVGWLKTGSGTAVYSNGAVLPRPVSMQVTVKNGPSYDSNSNTLTINGAGFTGTILNPTKLAFKYSRMTGPDWRPGSDATFTVTGDSKVSIQLGDADAQAFETKFSGRNVFLSTDPGWLVYDNGPVVDPLEPQSIWFYVSL